jgi:3-oxoacyl-[acyl-carrier-protein] synthase-3
MLSIIDIGLAFPQRTERLPDLAGQLSLSRNQLRMFDRFFGFDRFHCDDDEPQHVMLSAAAVPVLSRNMAEATRLSHVGHCHTLPSTSVFSADTSAILEPFHDNGLEVFSATMNHCATGITLLQTMSHLLDQDQTGLILIGEKAFHPDIRVIETTTIMGEAAAAVLVGHGPGRFRLLGTLTRHATAFWQNNGHRDENYLEGFEEAYLPFACQTMQAALAEFGIEPAALRFVLPHNVNVTSWLQIAQQTGFGRDQLWLTGIGKVGHCFGADPFINLAAAADQGRLTQGDLVLLFSIGLGATASCALLEVTSTRQ